MLGYLKAYALYPYCEKQQNRDIRSKLQWMKNFESQPFDQRKTAQQNRIIDLLHTCNRDVPYYRDLFKEIGFNPEDLRTNIQNIDQLPYTTKDIIVEQGDRLINEKLINGSRHFRKTGGSTGASTLIQYDQTGLDWTAAANMLAVSMTGRKHHQRECHISAEFGEIPHWKDGWREKVKCWALNRSNAYISTFDEANLAKLWKQLKSIRPTVLQGHPSTLYALAQYTEKNNINTKHVIKFFESTGEMIDSKKVEFIENNLNLKVFNRFGSAEFGVFAHSVDTPLDMKIFDSIVYPEEFSMGNGQSELVLTGLTNEFLPLIRYQTGDLASIETREDGRYLTNVVGRVHDTVKINGSEYPTHYIQDVLDHKVGGIVEFQIKTQKEKKPILQIVPEVQDGFDSIIQKINNYFPQGFDIVSTNLDSLSRVGWRGKFRYVIEA